MGQGWRGVWARAGGVYGLGMEVVYGLGMEVVYGLGMEVVYGLGLEGCMG